MHANRHYHRSDLVLLAARAMVERGLQPEFSALADQQLAAIAGPASEADTSIRDLTGLLWCSIDNDDSLDLDQLTVCEVLSHGSVRVLVAIADVDALVRKGMPSTNTRRPIRPLSIRPRAFFRCCPSDCPPT